MPEEMKPEEVIEKMELLDHEVRALPVLLERMKEDFSKSPEGAELVMLEHAIHNFIDNKENFLRYFISKENGQNKREIDHLIALLNEHNKDTPLLNKLKEFTGSMDKNRRPPNWHEAAYYEAIKKELERLNPKEETPRFIAELDRLIGLLSKESLEKDHLPVREVTGVLADKKNTPKRKRMQEFGVIVDLWRLVYLRMTQTENTNTEADQIQKTLDLNLKELGISADLNKVPKGTNASILFLTEIKEKQLKDRSLIKLFEDLSEDEYHAILETAYSEKGINEVLRVMELYIQKIGNEATVNSVKTEARDEIIGHVSAETKRMAAEIDDAIKHLKKLFTERIADIKKTKVKEIAKVEAAAKDLEKREEESASALVVWSDTTKEIADIGISIDSHYTRAEELLALANAGIHLTALAAGWKTEDKFNEDLSKLLSIVPTPLVKEHIDWMRRLAGIRGRAEFHSERKKLMDHLLQLLNQIDVVCTKVPRFIDMAERKSRMREEAWHAAGAHLSLAEREALRYDREVGRLGLGLERYEQGLSPDEVEAFEHWRRAA